MSKKLEDWQIPEYEGKLRLSREIQRLFDDFSTGVEDVDRRILKKRIFELILDKRVVFYQKLKEIILIPDVELIEISLEASGLTKIGVLLKKLAGRVQVKRLYVVTDSTDELAGPVPYFLTDSYEVLSRKEWINSLMDGFCK